MDTSIGAGLFEASRRRQTEVVRSSQALKTWAETGSGFMTERPVTQDRVSQDAEAERAAIQPLVQTYLYLFSQQRWDDWIALWADDGVLEFPFAPAGRASRYVGKADILAYMQAVAARMAGRIQSEGLDYFHLHPLLDPTMICLEMAVKGRVLETGAPYVQKYISMIQTRDGKIVLYREYWNPLVSMDANGGREAWAAAFGSPETEGGAS
jgi:ketosteroid isomerase-like protein